MLWPHTAYSAYGVKRYFETADYYSQGNETVGQWGGRLAAEWGLTGTVTKDPFGQLCDGINPATGEQLTPRMNDYRRIGDDFVFSLPKDVGAWIMLLPPAERDAMLAMVERRVYQVMGMIEADVETRVRKDGAFENRPGDGLAYAGYRHTTSRPVDGQPPDPHPHWHMFAFNATRDAVEARIKAADFANIYRDRSYYEAVFYSLVAGDFAEAGLPIERRADGKWGLAGLQPLGVKFSKRTNEIEDEARRLNITEPDRKSKLGATTRSKKDKELSSDQLREAWDAQLTDDDRAALAAVNRREADGVPAVTPAEAVSWAIAHLGDKLSVFPERELKRVALLYGIGSVTPEQVAAELPRQGVITGEIDGRLMATTPELQDAEDYITGQAAGGRGSVAPVGVAGDLTRRMKGGKALNDEQWDAVTGLLESENRVNLVEGPAGAGKSSLLAKYSEGMKRSGQPVTWLATTTSAVGVLEEDGFKANTVARFLLDERMQEAARHGRVVVDETSMLGHKEAVKLFQIAEENDLKLIFVGDPMQHGAVARGALMRILKDYGGIRPFKVTEILRQENPEYRAAAQLLSEGKTVEGFDAIDGMGRIAEIADPTDRYRHMAADYLQALDDRKSVLVVSPTHAEARHITAAIRSELRHAGRLGLEDHGFTRLVPVDTSEAERGLVTTYRPGDVIQFHQNAKGGFTKGDRLTVTDPAAVPLEHAAKFSLYRPESIELAEGDRIRFTGNVKTLDGEHTLKNGNVHTVAG
jgi:conjugative relaxase-like TrwC/TraI family protein